MVLRKSGTIVITKIIVAWIVGMLCVSFMPAGMIQTGFFAGLSTLAIVTSMDMTNGGLYASIMQQYGTKEEAGAFVLTSIESGPLVTMAILGSTGAAYFEPRLFIGAVLPFIIGFVLGNLDKELRAFFGNASMTMIPFFGFALGNTINLTVLGQTGFLGLLLGVGVIIVTGIPRSLQTSLLAVAMVEPVLPHRALLELLLQIQLLLHRWYRHLDQSLQLRRPLSQLRLL
jgi:2-keto-3-deoxygluconate permease